MKELGLGRAVIICCPRVVGLSTKKGAAMGHINGDMMYRKWE